MSQKVKTVTKSKYKGWTMVSSLVACVTSQTIILPCSLPMHNAMAFVGMQNLKLVSLSEAQKITFPGVSNFVEFELNLTDDLLSKISKKSNIYKQSQDKDTKAWKALDFKGNLVGYFLLDKVYGKHELITYSVGLSTNGTVAHVEILDYKETYGGQVDQKDWRGQFVGKKLDDKLELDKDIKNISGATLSCKHITNGVKRMLALYDTVLRDKA